MRLLQTLILLSLFLSISLVFSQSDTSETLEPESRSFQSDIPLNSESLDQLEKDLPELEEPNFEDFDIFLMDLFHRYDKDRKGFYTKEDYKNILLEIMLSNPENDSQEDEPTEKEKQIYIDLIGGFIDKKGKEKFLIHEVFEDLHSHEFADYIMGKSEESFNEEQNTDKAAESKAKKEEKKDCDAEDSSEGMCPLPEQSEEKTHDQNLEEKGDEKKDCEEESSEGMCPLPEQPPKEGIEKPDEDLQVENTEASQEDSAKENKQEEL